MCQPLEKKKILGVFAHREDFVVFGWPIFQNENIKRSLLVCTNDGEKPISEVCENEEINYYGTVGLDNRFSYMGGGSRLREHHLRIVDSIHSAIALTRPDYIFTHNPMGEYGHYDHTMLFRLVYNYFPKQNIIITDIMANSRYTVPVQEIPRLYEGLYREKICEVEPDHKFYKENGDIFKKYDLWTHNKELHFPTYPVKPAGLYLLKGNHVDTQRN